MYGFWYYDPTMIILIPAIIFTIYAQGKVSSAYSKYANIPNRRSMTGAEAARRILDHNGLMDVNIEMSRGKLSDHYDPRHRVMRLSPEVYNNPSVAAVSIAAHESGHAIQHGKGYAPLNIRNAIAPVVSIVSNLSWFLIIIGLFMGPEGTALFSLGVLFFCGAVVFQAITLPVEFNASSRAIAQLNELGIVYPEESEGARKVLSAAALTYVAALLTSVLQLLRLLAIRNRR